MIIILSVHPSCMDYSDKLIKKLFQSQPAGWQCVNCKSCIECQEANEDDCMLFCDACDQGFHMACHRPPLLERPQGKWECSRCCTTSTQVGQGHDQQTKAPLHSAAAAATNNHRDEENTRFQPLIPPQLHPSTGLLPDNWEDYDIDPHIPDVSEWEPVQLRDFFSKKGFSEAHSAIFLDQVHI